LDRLVNSESDSTILEEIIIKQKINNLLHKINSVVNGNFKEVDNNLMYAEQGLNKPIPLENVSAGIKMFLIIKRLLELDEINERDILIFDEPEIHLHPDWQIKFAEILILLQKEFNLTILLATHSPYFLHAIEIYCEKHGISDKLKCYLTESKDDISGIHDVTENIDTIYKQLARPFQKLEDTRYGN
jgi:predicted ATP-dependent endonuclease of OLD family